MEDSKQYLIKGIVKGEMTAFEELYKEYYVFLCLVAEHIVHSSADAEEIVSDVFIRLWKIRDKIEINTSIKAYLVKAVYNTSVNYLEQNYTVNKLTDSLGSADLKLLAWESDYPLGKLFEKETREVLESAISTLPEVCRKVFLMSRNEDLKYSEIAEKLGISVNTVKAHMKVALARLRDSIK